MQFFKFWVNFLSLAKSIFDLNKTRQEQTKKIKKKQKVKKTFM